MTDPLDSGPEVLSILDALRRHRVVATAMLIVVAFGALAYRQLLKPPAIAESRVVVENPRLGESGVGSANPVAYFADQLALARLPTVTNQALTALQAGGSLSDVRISADPASDTIVFTTTLPGGNAPQALALTDAIVTNYVTLSQSARRQQARASLANVNSSLLAVAGLAQSTAVTSLRTQLTTRQTALTVEAQSPANQLTVSPAELQPSGIPGLTRLGLVAILGGTLLALAIAVSRDGARRRLTHAADAAGATGLPVLAVLPLGRRRRVAAHAAWAAIIPQDGVLLLAVATDGLAGEALDDDALAGLFGPSEPQLLMLTLPVLRTDFADPSTADAPAVIVAGPLTTVQSIREARADLDRAHITSIGLVWTERPRGSGLLPGRAKQQPVSTRKPTAALRRPPGALVP